MKLTAIVPLNSPTRAKSRLAGALDSSERAALARWLAHRVLNALHEASGADIAVVSPDDEILRWAGRRGAQPVRQEGVGLNDALDIGRIWALQRGADALMVVLGDLPLLTADDARSLMRLAAQASVTPWVAIAPDRAAQGTNILLLRPPMTMPFAFGDGSLARHLALARAVGVEPQIVQMAGAAFDVDTPADLRELDERGLWRPAGAYSRQCEGEAS